MTPSQPTNPNAPEHYRVKRSPVALQVAEAVRRMILIGELRPGEVVTQQRLSSMLDVSTMPVREALLRLSHEGLVEARTSKSFRVMATKRGDIEAIIRVQAMLSAELTARASTNAAEREALVRSLMRIDREWDRTGEATVLAHLNWQFHRDINRAADSPKLAVLLRTAVASVPEYLYSTLPEWPVMSQRGHKEIIYAIVDGDAAAAGDAAARHVTESGELVIHQFNGEGYWELPDGIPSPPETIGGDLP